MNNVSKIIHIIAKEVNKFDSPSVSEIAETKDPFKVFISCILSLRTRDEVTSAASERLFKVADTPEKILKLSNRKIERLIYPVGFFRVKAKNIKEVCNTLINEYNSKVPNDIDELLKLKGIGRKTANIVLVFAYNKDALPIDTHCHRIPNRLGWIKTKTPEETEKALESIIPRKDWKIFNDVFVTFGQNICKPIRPKCGECLISSYCTYFKKRNS